MGKRIAYQGIIGSFSSMAARALYGDSFEAIHTTRFRDIFEHVTRGAADCGVIPIENALAGSVHENYDLLQEYQCFVVDEYYCPVSLHLVGLGERSSIRRVISHPKALEQCSRFFEGEPRISAEVHSDTAGAARHVAETNDSSLGAIASEEAAHAYGLRIIDRSVQNHATNMTRFVAISAQPSGCVTPTKCSLVVTVTHTPGSLYTLLGEVAALSINVTKIESRPIAGRPFEYAFHLDLECDEGQSPRLVEATARVRSVAREYRELGAFQSRPPA